MQMSYRTNSDNIFPVGAFIAARTEPDTRLIIKSYNQRIYYCDAVGDESGKQKVYFERELIAPDASNSKLIL